MARARIPRLAPSLTFAEKVEPIVRLCERIIVSAQGERCRTSDRRRRPGTYRGGYYFPAPVEPNSESDYALRILSTLQIACDATDRDEALKHAWDASQLIFDAQVVFGWKKKARHAAAKAAEAHRRRAARRRRGAQAWQAEVDARRPGLSQQAVMRNIADRDGLTVDAVKKALQRRRKRMTQGSASPTK
jgi:hypothetical protein